jgi:hypothetical protein
MRGMATKERLHELIDALPDTPETELRLDSVVQELEPNGGGDDHVEEAPVPTLEESIAILASVDFPPREDAWR